MEFSSAAGQEELHSYCNRLRRTALEVTTTRVKVKVSAGLKDMSVLENSTVPLIDSHQNLYLFLAKEEIRMKVSAGEVLFLHSCQALCNVILENVFYCKSESVAHSVFLCLFTVRMLEKSYS